MTGVQQSGSTIEPVVCAVNGFAWLYVKGNIPSSDWSDNEGKRVSTIILNGCSRFRLQREQRVFSKRGAG
jgi:hypothetical protein